MTEQAAERKQQFRVGTFEGPLDLLLFLINKSEINIYDIPIARITEQYLEYLSYVTRVDLDNITEFYVMAATLLLIKSRLLLPVEVRLDEELEDPRRELVEKLIEYQKYKKLSELIEEKERENEWVVERPQGQRILPFKDEELWEQIGVWDLLTTFSAIISSISPEKIVDLFEEVSINEKITLLRELLENHPQVDFTELLHKNRSVLDVICSFLAILELAKKREIVIMQNRLFGAILIRKRGSGENGA